MRKAILIILCLPILCGCLSRVTYSSEDNKSNDRPSAIIVELAYPTDFEIPPADIYLVDINKKKEYYHRSDAISVGGGDYDNEEEYKESQAETPIQNKITIEVPPGVYVVYAYVQMYDMSDIVSAVRDNPNEKNALLSHIKVEPGQRVDVILTFYDDDWLPYISEIPPRGESFLAYQKRRSEILVAQDEKIKKECLKTQRQLNENLEFIKSPDGKWTAFVEWTAEHDSYALGDGYAVQSQIKLINNETQEAAIVVPYQINTEPKENMQKFDNITWAPDSRGFYFTCYAWVTSTAIHYYNLSSGKTKYFAPGLGIEIIDSGEYKGYIETSHTTIEEGKGRVGYKVAISPDGKTEIKLSEPSLDMPED